MTALQGLRVLDLSHNRVGAQVSQLFADFGADVVWVEPPGGAAIRSEAAFPFWARGKSSVEIDLRSPAGQAAIRRLASDADVLVETFRPGVLDRYGLGYEDLAELNPRLVYTSVTGFGSIGPNVNVKGYEALVAAKLGVLQTFAQLTAPEAPPFAAVPWCSFSASQVALHGTLAALIERESSGSGQRVEASLAQAFTALDTWSWFERLIEHKWPGAYKRVANFDAAGEPTSPFPYFLLVALTSDGHWLQFAQVAPHLFKALMDELGLTWMFTDPAWAGIPVFEDVERRAQLWRKMLEAANTKTLAEWTAVFDSNPNVFAEVFRSSSDILEHPQLVADQMVLTINDHEHGPVTQPGPLAKLYTTPAIIDRSAPALGGTASFSDAPAGHDATEVDTAAGASGLPLEGITVVEFAGLFAAPHGATLLTDLGARVIKVEPLDGDPIRKIIPFPESGGAKVMQGKESICIDVGTDEGLALAHRLVESADVVLQGYRAGVAERMGLGYDRLRSINPTLVYLNAPGYGVGAPFGHRPAYAPSIGAAVGIARTMVGNRAVERAGMTMEEICNTSRTLTLSMNSNAQADGFAALGVAPAMLQGLRARKRG
ncbi:MAG: CoA transferase, partial [Acidimicrobiia bacterium]